LTFFVIPSEVEESLRAALVLGRDASTPPQSRTAIPAVLSMTTVAVLHDMRVTEDRGTKLWRTK